MTKQRVDFIAFMFSLILALALSVGWAEWNRRVKEQTPATDFLSIREFNIPDFVEGDDPTIVLDASIKQDFSAKWNINVNTANVASGTSICNRPGSGNYNASQKPPETLTLNTFMQRNCGLPAGQYVIDLAVDIEAPGYPTKHYSAVSNVFRIFPEGYQIGIDKEQIEQLRVAKELLEHPIPLVEGVSPPQ